MFIIRLTFFYAGRFKRRKEKNKKSMIMMHLLKHFMYDKHTQTYLIQQHVQKQQKQKCLTC